MKKTLFLALALGAATTTGIAAPQAPSKVLLAQAQATQSDKIAQVKAGTLKQAYASWWGFDKNDATEALQNAINSGVSELIIDNTGSDWIINKPITLVSNQRISFERGVVIQAKKGEFHGRNDSLFVARKQSNIKLIAHERATLRMQRADYDNLDLYTKSEWRHGIGLWDCENVEIRNLTVAETGGDGLYLGASPNGYNKHVLVENCDFIDNYRQGISVISAENFMVHNTRMNTTDGTAPMAGIDYEPNHPGQRLVNCVIDNSEIIGNAGSGVAIYAVNLNGDSKPISITIKNTKIKANQKSGFGATITRSMENPLQGKVLFDNCLFDHQNIRINNPLLNGVQFDFKDCVLDFTGDKTSTPIWLGTSGIQDPLIGGVHFDNTTVKGDADIVPLNFEIQKGMFGYKPYVSSQIDGTLFVQSKGEKKQVNLPRILAGIRGDLVRSNPTNNLKKQFSEFSIDDISKRWNFLPDPAEGQNVTEPQFDDSSWKVINGGSRMWWQKQGFADYHGVAWYRKTIDIPQLSGNQQAFLYFNGVDGTTQVYVNGKQVGEHIVKPDFSNWNETFQIDVTQALRPGNNTIALRVTSKSEDTASGINEAVFLVIGTRK